MNEIDKKRLEVALDKVIEKFNNQDFITQDFIKYSQILKLKYFQNESLHRKKRKCVVIGCEKETIKKSHSIPKSSILKTIAINGHVLKPEFDFGNHFPKNKMTEIGINNASVFPGYCVKHESIFESFEADGKFDNAKKAILQTYRTICRERVYREIELEINNLVKDEYKKKINEEAQEYLVDLLSVYPQFNNVENIEIEGIDSVINSLNYQNKHLLQPKKQFDIFEKNIYNYILNLPNKNNLIVRVVNIDFHLPISVCGFGNQTYIQKNEKKNACVLINVMPQKSSTSIICVGLEQDKALIENFLDFSFSNPFNILNLVESFIINGTDHWFINPEYWNSFTQLKQEKILYDILFSENSFLDEYNFSIFDETRDSIIKILTNNINSRPEPITPFEVEKINHEKAKLKNTDYDIIKDVNILIDKLNKMLYQTD